MNHYLKYMIVAVALSASAASATTFDVPGGDLKTALDNFMKESGEALMYPTAELKGVHTSGVKGELSSDDALLHILAGTGFVMHRHASGMVGIVRSDSRTENLSDSDSLKVAAMPAPSVSGASLETVTVTSSKIGGDVQNIPISITALSQEQLTATQTAGGPDLVKQVPNLTFTKTNFTGYSIQIRGIGTQAISVTTDPAVAVAFNDIPFIRNHFFEQEFYDVSQVEILRGPQGTLYGRNATAGVVNLVSAKPSDQFEAMASADVGNYGNRRLEAMINVPIVDDWLDIRVAGEWTKRQGYSLNELTDSRIDGRDLWSGRVTIGWKPDESLQTYLVWEHFSEDDDRMRTAKQLCKTDPIPATIGGVGTGPTGYALFAADFLSQSCEMTSLYSPDAFEVPEGNTLPYVVPLEAIGGPAQGIPYAGTTQSRNLRVIDTSFNPAYQSKNDTVEFNADYTLTPALTFSSQTAFNHDFLYSTEDYNRFNTAPGIFGSPYCDPQVGCSTRLVAEDLSKEHAWQLGQEFRVTSNFSGPFNFSFGANYLHYETEEDYYVFINSLSAFASTAGGYDPTGKSDNSQCLNGVFKYPDPSANHDVGACGYIDPNPISSLNGNGHNYFRSANPYVLNSYAGFGEAYYSIFSDLKLTTGLRWTDDRKHFTDIPSELLVGGWGYPSTGVVDQQWNELTGRAAINWTPKLDFTDQTLLYASYAHGYKAGGANPPGAVFISYGGPGEINNPIHPLTFKPEFIDAFELGAKNTLFDGAITVNANVFYYNYENYQISEIVDRTSINLNFDAHVKGAEVESTWEPVPGLRFNFAGGWEDTALAKGDQAVDLMDRTAGHTDWVLVKPFPTQASNCILPVYVIAYELSAIPYSVDLACGIAYNSHHDPVTDQPYKLDPTVPNLRGDPIVGYPGFDPTTAPNNGGGFDKDLSGNELPNAPPFTVSFGAQYTVPISQDWASTLRGDYYWQDYSWARVFNDNPYDRLRGYTNLNLTLILTNQNGWQVMLYDKNVFNVTDITGTFLNSDDTGLTTNVFLTDPKLIGIRVTKNW